MRWYSRHPRVLWRQTPGATVLLPAGGGEVLALSGAGSRLWELIEYPVSVDTIVAGMTRTFAISPAEVIEAVMPILRQLTGLEAVKVDES